MTTRVWSPRTHLVKAVKAASLQSQPQKMKSQGSPDKSTSKTNHIHELWVWLRWPDSANGVEKQLRMIPDISLVPLDIHVIHAQIPMHIQKHVYVYCIPHIHETWKKKGMRKKCILLLKSSDRLFEHRSSLVCTGQATCSRLHRKLERFLSGPTSGLHLWLTFRLHSSVKGRLKGSCKLSTWAGKVCPSSPAESSAEAGDWFQTQQEVTV